MLTQEKRLKELTDKVMYQKFDGIVYRIDGTVAWDKYKDDDVCHICKHERICKNRKDVPDNISITDFLHEVGFYICEYKLHQDPAMRLQLDYENPVWHLSECNFERDETKQFYTRDQMKDQEKEMINWLAEMSGLEHKQLIIPTE